MTQEPERLRRGREFHKLVQAEWEREAQGRVTAELGITKLSGRRGRIDVHVDADDVLAVVELKASDWDRMTERAVNRNIRRQLRQIWNYIESQLDDSVGVSPGIIFPTAPQSPERKALIEELFYEEGIVAVWHDE